MDDITAGLILDDIEADMADRSGLGDVWNTLSDEVREEIRTSWMAIIEDLANG